MEAKKSIHENIWADVFTHFDFKNRKCVSFGA